MAVNGSGNVYVTGSFKDTVNFNPNPGPAKSEVPWNSNTGDVFVLKLDSGGDFDGMGDYGDDTGGAADGQLGYGWGTSIEVAPTGNDIVVVGVFDNTIDFRPDSGTTNGQITSQSPDFYSGFAVELNSDLSFQWVQTVSFPTPTAEITAAAFDPRNDNVYVGGYFAPTLSATRMPSSPASARAGLSRRSYRSATRKAACPTAARTTG